MRTGCELARLSAWVLHKSEGTISLRAFSRLPNDGDFKTREKLLDATTLQQRKWTSLLVHAAVTCSGPQDRVGIYALCYMFSLQNFPEKTLRALKI